jgi:hypothetical protein
MLWAEPGYMIWYTPLLGQNTRALLCAQRAWRAEWGWRARLVIQVQSGSDG